jgi:hypothetical protein
VLVSGRLVHARPTVRLRRWIAAICLGLVVLLASAVAVVRVHFEGPDLAENVCDMMNERMRGRISIASIDWPMSSLPKVASGGWMPVTLRDVKVWDDKPEAGGVLVARTERITAELDLHALLFGRHDFVLRKVKMHGGEVLLREVTEPYPLHDYDKTVFSIMAAFYGRRSAGSFHTGVFATSSPLWDLSDFEIKDVDLELRVKPLNKAGTYYMFRSVVADVSAKGFLYMDPSDPLVPKFYLSMGITGGAGQIDVFYSQDKEGNWKPHGEYSFPVKSLDVRRLAQLPSRWPADPVANTLRFDVRVETMNGARAHIDGSMIDYWDTPYGGIWDVTARVENAGTLLRQSVDSDAGGDNVTLEAVVTGPIVFFPSVAIKATGLTYKMSMLEPPLLLELDTLIGVYDLAVDEGSVDEFIARGSEGEVRLSAKWGGDGSDRSPFWVDSDIDIRKPIEMRPWLSPTLATAVGTRLDGHFHALRRKGDTKYGISIDKMELRLGLLALDQGQIYVDKGLDKVLLEGVQVTIPGFKGKLTRCSMADISTVPRFVQGDCKGTYEFGSAQELQRLMAGGFLKQKTEVSAPKIKKRPKAQPRRSRFRRSRTRHAQQSPVQTRDTGGKGTFELGGTIDDIKLKTEVALSQVPCIGALRGSIRYEGDKVIIDDARSTSLGGRLRITGQVDIEPAAYFEPIRAVATSIDLSRTCSLGTKVTGKVSADVSLRGPPDPKRLTYTGWACSDRVAALGETFADVAVWMNRTPGKLSCSATAPVAVRTPAVETCLQTGGGAGGRCIIARARRETGGELSAAIHADRGQRLGGELRLSRVPLAALMRLAGASVPADAIIETVETQASSGLALGGTVDGPTLAGVVRLGRTWVGGGYLGDGEVRLEPNGTGSVRFSASFQDGRVAVSGTLGTRAPYPLDMIADVQQVEVDTFVDLVALGAPPKTRVWGTGRVRLQTALGDEKAPLAVTLDLADLAIVGELPGPDGQPTPLAVRAAAPLQLTWDGATATLTQPARLSTPIGEITVSGKASPTKLDLIATGRLDLLKAQPLLGAYFDRTTGTAALEARVTGSSLAPRVKVTLDLEDVALRLVGRGAMLRVPGGRIEFTDGELSLTGIGVLVDDGYTRTTNPLTVAGGVTFKGFTPNKWALIVSGELAGEMLMAFAPETFAQASGASTLLMTLTGEGETPLISGDLSFVEGQQLRLLPRSLRREIALDKGQVSFLGDPETGLDITVEGIGGKIDDEGTLTNVSGSLSVVGGAVAAADLTASADALTFRLQRTLDLVINLDGIHVALADGRLRIGGVVELTTGRYTRNFDLAETLTPSTPSGPSAPPIWETSSLVGDADLDLQIDVRKFSVVNNLANIDLYGRISISGSPRDPRFDDTIHVERGTLQLPAVRAKFTRTSGRVEFSPLLRFPGQTPVLDLVSEADYRDPSGQDHLITLRIGGNWTRLTWDLSTSSGLDKAQTLTLILSGRTPEELRRNLGDDFVSSDPTRVSLSTDTSQGVTDELLRQVAGDMLGQRVAEPLRQISNLDVARIELNLSSFAFHAEERIIERFNLIGDFERTNRGSSVNLRIVLALPHHILRVLSSWNVEINGLLKNFDDQAEEDVTDLELKMVFQLLRK